MIIATGCVAVIAAVLMLIWTMQRRLMYFPTVGVPAPAEIGLTDVEPVTFETTDGLVLSGWFVAASGPSPRVTVLVFNGNAGNRAHRAPLAAAAIAAGQTDFIAMGMDRAYCGAPQEATAEEGERTFGILTKLLVDLVREVAAC